LPSFFQKVGFKPITVIRYKVSHGDTIYNPRRLNRSPLHIYTALLANEFLKRFERALKDDQSTETREIVDLQLHNDTDEKSKWTVGVISPYRAQASLIGKLIESTIPYNSRLSISVDTVHGFQGDENQLIVAVFNPGNENVKYSRFLHEAHILNVAISRSEDYLVLFVPEEGTTGFDKLPLLNDNCEGSILNILSLLPQEHIAQFTAEDLEEALTEQQLYFEKYTRTAAHFPVNVYGKPETPYLFRLAGNAVDVHWQTLP
jgi:hypothetical protein